jgi:hypothetical protein
MRSRRLAILIGIALVGVAAGIFALRGEEPTPPQVAELTSEALAPPKLAAPVASIVPAQVDAKPAAREIPLPPAKKAARAAEHTEDEIMAQLRELGATNPALTLKLAREGNQRFKHSPDAPERASDIVRALLNLERREEARAEALKMEEEYPDSDWTRDVHRHMFVNPPTHPTERGYGKEYELE